MKHTLLSITILLLCTQFATAQVKHKDITVVQADSLIQAVNDTSLLKILDIRTKMELNNGYIKNSIHIDYFAPGFRKKVKAYDKDQFYLLYCKTGVRSKAAAKKMVKWGFEYVYNMEGGIVAWTKEGYEIVTNDN